MTVIVKIIKSMLTMGMLLLINVTITYACTCIGPANAKEGLSLSEAVFSGKVIKSNEYRAEVEVERVWKGKFTHTRVTVLNPAPKTSCSIALKQGQRYIVFSTVDKNRGRLRYTPQICFHTSLLGKAEQTLKEIGEGEPLKKRRLLSRP